MAEIDNMIIISDSEGNEIEVEVLDYITHRGQEYIVFLPADDEDGDVVIMEAVTNDDGSETYYETDQAIVDEVFQIFKAKYKDDFDFGDEDDSGIRYGSNSDPEYYDEGPEKCRSRFILLLITWVGAWYAAHISWLGDKETAREIRADFGGIGGLLRPSCWIFHILECIKVLFGKYRFDAYGNKVRYLSFLHNSK